MPTPRKKRKTHSGSRRSARSIGEYEFNPNSFNAQFAGLHAKLRLQTDAITMRLTSQDALLSEIREQTTATNGRVTSLEGVIDTIKTVRRITKRLIVGIASAVSSIIALVGVFSKFLWH